MDYIPPRLKRARLKLAQLQKTEAHCQADKLLTCLLPGIRSDILLSKRAIARLEAELATIN